MGLFDFIFGRKKHCRLGIKTCSFCPHNPKKKLYEEEKIQREKGYLYFIGRDGYIWAAPLKHNNSKFSN